MWIEILYSEKRNFPGILLRGQQYRLLQKLLCPYVALVNVEQEEGVC